MTRVGYLDLASGISGDMLLAAIASAGRELGVAADQAIADAVASLGLGCTVRLEPATRGGLACVTAFVDGGDVRPGIGALRDAIARADVSGAARGRALAGLDAIIAAEAKVHGVPPEDVHLHELGAADTAADLVGTAAGLDTLGIGRLHAAPVPLGRGHIRTDHGEIPVPVPTVAELVRGAPVRGIDETVEIVTPTGAAILRAHDAAFGPMPAMTLQATGTGGGGRDLQTRPNVLRLFVGEPSDLPDTTSNVLLECNVDDATPETVAYAMAAALDAGASDAWSTPIVMKKSRAAVLVSVLCRPEAEADLTRLLFRETTTLGIRRSDVAKRALHREFADVVVRGCRVRVKIARLAGEIVTISPEYEDCAAAARALGLPLRVVADEARALAG